MRWYGAATSGDVSGRMGGSGRWIWASIAFWVCVLQVPSFVADFAGSAEVLPDFYQDWASARNYGSGRPVYTRHDISIPLYLGSLSADRHPLVQVNAHPPTSVLLALPLAGLEFHSAVLLWNLISLALLLASVGVVAGVLRLTRSWWSLGPMLSLLLTCGPLREDLRYGQLALLLTFLVTCAWAAERKRKDALAGLLLGAAATIKLFPAFLLAYYMVRGRWRFAAAGLSSILCLTLLTVFVLGPECYQDYFFKVVPEIQWFRVGWGNLSITGFWSRLFDPAPDHPRPMSRTDPIWYSPTFASAASIASCLAVSLALVLATRNSRRRRETDLGFAMASIVMILASPIAWDHYLMLLLAPLAILWGALSRRAGRRAAFYTVLATLWISPWLVFEIAGLGGRVATPFDSLTLLSYQTYALLGLFGLGAWELKRLARRETGSIRRVCKDSGSSTPNGNGPATLLGAL